MNIQKKTTSISFRTLIYLVVFSVSILLLLWVSQIVYFRYFYEHFQVKNMNEIANSILSINTANLDKDLENIAYKKEVCIEVIWNNKTSTTYNGLMVGCELGQKNEDIMSIQKKFLESLDNTSTVRLENKEYHAEAYMYALKTNIGSIFLYSPLEDLSSASTILKNQLIYLTVIAIFFACLVAYFLSRQITKPILDITKKAKDLGKGNYNIKFPQYDIEEVNDLAKVLDNAKDELHKTDELRRDLMANVSHDLKTPLTMIRAYAEMVRDMSYKDDEKRNLHCNIIMNETDRLNLLVNDILTLSKMEALESVLEYDTFDLVSVVNEIIKKYEIIKETENYHFQLISPKKALVYADKKRIYQVIYNLVNNAINYTGEDKVVKIRIKKARNEYLVEIIDTGVGISESDLNRIWDKYYKNDKNHRRNVVGSGIGLSICKSILEQHHFKYGVK